MQSRRFFNGLIIFLLYDKGVNKEYLKLLQLGQHRVFELLLVVAFEVILLSLQLSAQRLDLCILHVLF